MKKRISRKKHKLFFIASVIAAPLIIMTQYNWWVIAMIILTFLIIALMTEGPKDKKREL